MRKKLLSTVLVATLLGAGGCASPPVAERGVSVLFAPPPDMERFNHTETRSHLAASLPRDHQDRDFIASSPASAAPEAFTVALWGGDHHGDVVTHGKTLLQPGSYTFGFWDHDGGRALKGWVQVNFSGTTLVDILQGWKDRLPQQKQWLAYDFEIKGKLSNTDSAVFKQFARQLRAFDKLEREIDRVIANEMKMLDQRRQRCDEMLSETVVLMLPTGSGVFHPTTQPVFAPDDLARVESGESVTKFMLAADARDTRQKLRLVDGVCRSLVGCRAVLDEEVGRLERRKRYYVITDHIYDHDRKFVENEMRLQQTLNAIDRLNEQIAEIRERRLALAFVNGLVSPDQFLDPLAEEQRDLTQERTVLSSRKRRLDLLFEESAENGPRRIVFQRQRQRVGRAIEDIDRYVESLDEARLALSELKDATRVIHRQGDMRLLAASVVDRSVPSVLRDALERHALLTVRLESSPTPFERFNDKKAVARTAAFHADPSGP